MLGLDFGYANTPQRDRAMTKITKSDDEWKAQLTPTQYEVTRHAATERPGTGQYLHHHEHGV